MADDLRARLIAAKISGAKTGQGYEFRTNENAADVALGVFVGWLDEQANACAIYAVSAGNIGRRTEDERYLARRLRDFSVHIRSLTQPSTEEKR